MKYEYIPTGVWHGEVHFRYAETTMNPKPTPPDSFGTSHIYVEALTPEDAHRDMCAVFYNERPGVSFESIDVIPMQVMAWKKKNAEFDDVLYVERPCLEFQDQVAFGSLCLELKNTNVKFSLGGFHTIFLDQRLSDVLLSIEARKILEEAWIKKTLVVKSQNSPRGRRKLVSTDEAHEILKEHAETM